MESFCPQCGAPGWAYDGSQLQCGNCGHSRSLPREARAIEEKALVAPPVTPQETGIGLEDILAWSCTDCKEVILSNHPLAEGCPFCGGSLNEEPEEDTPEVQRPALVLPFTLPEDAAKEKLRNWVNPNILRPPGLSEGFSTVKLHGIYVPFWVYDVSAEATWKATAAYLYFNRLQEEDTHDTGEPWEVQKIRYTDTGGYYAHTFQHMLIPLSKDSLTKHIQSLIEEEELKDIVPYDARYAFDFEYAVQTGDPADATAEATKTILKQIEEAAGEDVDADFHRDVDVQMRMEGLALRQVLLPIWVVAMQYRGKPYHACIHGRNGKIKGAQPWSPLRVGILIGFLVALIFVTVIILEKWVL